MTQVPKGSSGDCSGTESLKKELDRDGEDRRGAPKEGTFSWAMRLVRESDRGGG